MTTSLTKSTTTIEINDQTYNSIDEVPDEFRNLVIDKNNNGMPDFVESEFKSGSVPPRIIVKSENVKTYRHDKLPPEIKAQLKNTFKDTSSNNIPDIFEKKVLISKVDNPKITVPTSSNQELLIRLGILVLGLLLGAVLFTIKQQ